MPPEPLPSSSTGIVLLASEATVVALELEAEVVFGIPVSGPADGLALDEHPHVSATAAASIAPAVTHANLEKRSDR